jgi:hypothetical protein
MKTGWVSVGGEDGRPCILYCFNVASDWMAKAVQQAHMCL